MNATERSIAAQPRAAQACAAGARDRDFPRHRGSNCVPVIDEARPSNFLSAVTHSHRPFRTAVNALVIAGSCLLLAALAAPAQAADRAPSAQRDPAVPSLSKAETGYLRQIFRQGLAMGNHPRSFIKVGDSISWTPLYLQGISCKEEKLDGRSWLKPTIKWFRALRLPAWASDSDCGGDDPFGRDSTATRPYQPSQWPMTTPPTYPEGLPADTHCDPSEAPLQCEEGLLLPSIALVMIGTNDAQIGVDSSEVRENVREIVTWLKGRGTIPVLSTIPPRLDTPERTASAKAYNAEIRDLGASERVPLIDLYRAFRARSMTGEGMSADGVHPSVLGGTGCWLANERCRSVDFTQRGLRFGHNRRNLITLETLDLLRRKVIVPVLTARDRG